MTSQLVGSSFANGALLPNYVNGRLLAAEDLATGQSTLLQRDTWIGQAAGPGIVTGLIVTATATSLSVAMGLGLTPSGEPVSVPAQVTLSLSIAGTPAAPIGGSFATCTTTPSGAQAAVTTGAYLLTAMPACQLQGQAPMAIPPGSDTPVACTAQWLVEGVQFKAIPLPFGAAVDGITVTAGNSRNLLAHWCFGTAQLAALGVDPFSFAPAYRGLDQLASTDLTHCDLPLCVFYWDAGTMTFIDNWSVRRRTTRPDVSGPPWSAAVADQRSADGEARFLQFQDQVSDLMSTGASGYTVASDIFFGLLPPVGFLPVAFPQDSDEVDRLFQVTEAPKVPISEAVTEPPTSFLASDDASLFRSRVSQLAPQPGFWPPAFFGRLASFGGFITWDTAYFALRQSYSVEPVATTASGENAEPVITYYFVLENAAAVAAASGAGMVYIVFVKNQVWPKGTRPPFVAQQSFLADAE